VVWDGGKIGGSAEGNREGRGVAERSEAGQPASLLEDREGNPQQAHRKHHGNPLRKQQEHQAGPPQGVHRRKRGRTAIIKFNRKSSSILSINNNICLMLPFKVLDLPKKQESKRSYFSVLVQGLL
jgi:hypothetical protein